MTALLTVQEVADLLKTSRQQVRKMIHSGLLPAVRIGRYTCVNLQNRDTVEFRMFRGTLKPSTILATLELLDRICDMAVCLTDDELKAVPWTSFAAGVSKDSYPELIQYLKERRLYVKDIVESEEDA